MPRRHFLIKYPDDSRKHVDSFDREQMLLAGEIKKSGENEYRYVGQAHTFQRFHSLQELSSLGPALQAQAPRRRFLPGSFIIELGQKRHGERLETPEGLVARLGLA